LSAISLTRGLNEREVGLWIDQRKAVIVTITRWSRYHREHSSLEKQVHFSVGLSSDGYAEDSGDRKFGNNFGNYYEDVIACIRDAESIQIFGPGEAKLELEKRLKREKLGGLIVGIETVDKMSDRQIEAKVWHHFLS
jgi:hypothetical protein